MRLSLVLPALALLLAACGSGDTDKASVDLGPAGEEGTINDAVIDFAPAPAGADMVLPAEEAEAPSAAPGFSTVPSGTGAQAPASSTPPSATPADQAATPAPAKPKPKPKPETKPEPEKPATKPKPPKADTPDTPPEPAPGA